ncbi:MAG TPA: Gfo/Idh/MocA family oxidoreductase [Chthoniobacterales bacterium]|jgi:predicted dehydrogenase
MSFPRLGFLGVGWIGRARLTSISHANNSVIAVLADPDPDNLDQARIIAPEACVASSLEELLTHPLDGIVISTPSGMHAAQTIAALQAGCSVFCQKPLGRRKSEVQEMIDAARECDLLLDVDLSYRWLTGMQQIRSLIQHGELGEIFAANLIFHNAYGPDKPWFYDRQLSGGGCVLDLGIHLVDAALWTLSTGVDRVSARVFSKGQRHDPTSLDVEDFATARIDLASGAVADLACSWKLHAGRPCVIEMSFHGTKGGAAIRSVDGSFTDFRTERFTSTETEILSQPPEDWGGRAAVAWADQLAISRKYDSAIERQLCVAQVLDAIYQRDVVT